MEPLELGIVSDEIDTDFTTAAGHAVLWGITRFELRCLVTGRVPAVDAAEMRKVEMTVRERGLSVTALSPGVFKHKLGNSAGIEQELSDTLPRTIAMAQGLGASTIIAFGFQREEGEPGSNRGRAVEFLARAARIAEGAGVRIAIENEPGFWCDTGVNSRSIIREVGSRALGANWDPCNAYGTTERPYPEGYEAIKDVILNVHAKDTSKGALIQCVPIGDGTIDWPGQVRALLTDRPVPHITIETHCHPLVENSRRNVETLRALMRKG